MPTGNWKNYTDSDGLKALKTDHLLTDKKAKKSISLDSRFVDLENAGRSNTLMAPRNSNKNLVLHIYTEKTTLGNIWLLQLCNSLANSINLLLVQHLWETSKVYSNNSSHCMNSFPALHSWNLHRKGSDIIVVTFANWWKTRFSRRKLWRIACFSCAKRHHALKFRRENLRANSHKTAKLTKFF